MIDFRFPCQIARPSRAGRLAMFVIFALGLSMMNGAAQQPAPASPAGAAAASAKRPVILLTGFEPFGPQRPPNPSWEAIKDLDGQTWKGYQIVSKQVKVVWGAPLEQIGGWISEYQPVAVFSFGAGRPGIFAVETFARNQRGKIKDNAGNPPAAPSIVADGPSQLNATADSVRLVDALAKKSYPIQISRNAGKYLCEEALYSLEYLKASRKLSASVLFCHVPPLGSRISGEQKSTPTYVRKFVMDMLESWDELNTRTEPKALKSAEQQAGPNAVKPKVLKASFEQTGPADEPARKPSDDPRYPAVKTFVEHYFSTWSEQDMDGYDACFLPDAVIQFIDANGSISTAGKQRFVASQRAFHRGSNTRTVEVPENIDIRFEGKLARAVVYWKLTSGARIERGYDHFTLMTEEGHWRIVNLLFYGTSSGR